MLGKKSLPPDPGPGQAADVSPICLACLPSLSRKSCPPNNSLRLMRCCKMHPPPLTVARKTPWAKMTPESRETYIAGAHSALRLICSALAEAAKVEANAELQAENAALHDYLQAQGMKLAILDDGSFSVVPMDRCGLTKGQSLSFFSASRRARTSAQSSRRPGSSIMLLCQISSSLTASYLCLSQFPRPRMPVQS
jgi:hypothetical protein